MALPPSLQREGGFLLRPDWGSVRNTGRWDVTGRDECLPSHRFLESWLPFPSSWPGKPAQSSHPCFFSPKDSLPSSLPFCGTLRAWVFLPALLVRHWPAVVDGQSHGACMAWSERGSRLSVLLTFTTLSYQGPSGWSLLSNSSTEIQNREIGGR